MTWVESSSVLYCTAAAAVDGVPARVDVLSFMNMRPAEEMARKEGAQRRLMSCRESHDTVSTKEQKRNGGDDLSKARHPQATQRRHERMHKCPLSNAGRCKGRIQ